MPVAFAGRAGILIYENEILLKVVMLTISSQN